MAPDVADLLEEMTRAYSAAHRAWVMGRDLRVYDQPPDMPVDDDPAVALLWPRFPGW